MNERDHTKQEDKGRILLTMARAAISERLGMSLDGYVPVNAPWLDEKRACFVTLKINGGLRGCIGSLEARRPLAEDLHANAIAAAFQDPRFLAIVPDEFERLRIEVSILTPAEPMHFGNEEDAVNRLRPGVDGVVLQYHHHRGTFLPQVWKELPEPHLFLAHLKQKAGLSADFWHPDLLLYRYGVERFSEPER